MAGRTMQCENCSKQSLMTVLNNFVDAVQAMDDKVMVPSRLRDMEATNGQSTGHNITASEENNNMSVMPFSSGRGEDMYSYYAMINAVKCEILSGKSSGTVSGFGDSDCELDSSSDDGSDDGTSVTARKTAEAFRHHLQGLFGLLHQLTDTAKYLGDAYEEQIGGRKSKKFAI